LHYKYKFDFNNNENWELYKQRGYKSMQSNGRFNCLLIILFCLLASNSAYAKWWDLDWEYKIPITLDNTGNSTDLNNYQMLVSIDSSQASFWNNINSDGNDIRFLNSDENIELSHWIERWDYINNDANIWVEVQSIPPTSTTTIYLYYGNSNVSDANNGYLTFDYFDGMEDYDTGGDLNYPNEWARNAGNPVIEGSTGEWDSTGSTFASVLHDGSQYRMYYHGYNGSIHQAGLAVSSDGETWVKDENVLKNARVPMVWKEESNWYMLYTAVSPLTLNYATSTDGNTWTDQGIVLDDTAFSETEGCHEVIKIDQNYYVYYGNTSPKPRIVGIATSTDRINWFPYTGNPIFDITDQDYPEGGSIQGQFCPGIFKYGEYWYALMPTYSLKGDFSRFYLYRSTSHYFPKNNRDIVRIILLPAANGAWDDNDTDTPQVLTTDINRDTLYNDELWTYYAGEEGTQAWATGLLQETDVNAALTVKSHVVWDINKNGGTIDINNTITKHGTRSIELNDTSTTLGTYASVKFAARTRGRIGAWMQRSSASTGDFNLSLYGDTIQVAGVGFGNDGNFHYWDGNFHDSNVAFSSNEWYYLKVEWDTSNSDYNFTAFDENLSQLFVQNNIAFANALLGDVNNAGFYTGSTFQAAAYVDDFRLQKLTMPEPTYSLGAHQDTNTVGTITKIDDNLDNQALPTFSYAVDGNISIDFNVFDANNDRITVDINYSTTNTNGSGTVIVKDLNLTTEVCPSQDWDDNESKCSWDWNISGVADGNYYILIYSTSTTSSDFNASDNSFSVDQTAPTVSINSPSNGSSQTSTSVTLQYTGSDALSGIQKYWVKADSGNWIGNALNTSYAFTSQSIGSHTYYAKAADNTDNNSSTASISITINQAATAPAIIPSTATTTQTAPTPQTQTQIEETLLETGLTQAQIQTAIQASNQLQTTREITTTKQTGIAGTGTYISTITIKVPNQSNKTLTNIKIIEEIPKNIAESATQINSKHQFTILKDDPIIQFTIKQINPNQTAEITYDINKRILESEIGNWAPPITASFEEKTECIKECEQKTCQTTTCNPATEQCSYANKEEGTPCGTGKECKQGNCIEKIKPGTTEESTALNTEMAAISLMALLAILATTAILAKKRSQGKGKRKLGKAPAKKMQQRQLQGRTKKAETNKKKANCYIHQIVGAKRKLFKGIQRFRYKRPLMAQIRLVALNEKRA